MQNFANAFNKAHILSMTDISSIIIHASATMKHAMKRLQAAGTGIIIVTGDNGAAIGVLSDGDIRTALLDRESLETPVSDYMTRDFIWAKEGTAKEKILKFFDSRIRAIPILNDRREPVSLATPGYLEQRSKVFARAKAPVRLSLAGGGTDFTGFFSRHGGCSLSTTMAHHCHATLRKRDDDAINIHSYDLRQTIRYKNLDEVVYDGKLDLLKSAIKVLRPDFGFDLEVGSDFAPGSGLGGSASILAAVIGCFNEFRPDFLDLYTIAEYAYEAERVELDISGGWQDQYSTVFGGFNFIEFSADKNIVTPLRIPITTQLELEERFLLCYTGNSHRGEVIQKENRMRASDDKVMANFALEVMSIAKEMKCSLLRGNLTDFGRMLQETWEHKKSINPDVTTPHIDGIFDTAIAAGAEGGRLLGTGGGGYVLLFTKPFHRYEVAEALEKKGLKVESVVLDHSGMQSWSARP